MTNEELREALKKIPDDSEVPYELYAEIKKIIKLVDFPFSLYDGHQLEDYNEAEQRIKGKGYRKYIYKDQKCFIKQRVFMKTDKILKSLDLNNIPSASRMIFYADCEGLKVIAAGNSFTAIYTKLLEYFG